MNPPIARLFAIVLVLFAALVAFTSRWSVFDAQALRDNPQEPARAHRGAAREARDDPRRATGRCSPARRPRARARTGAGTPRRRSLLPQVIGFSDIDLGRAGIERSRNDELSGDAGALDDIVDQLKGGVEKGDDVRLEHRSRRPARRARGPERAQGIGRRHRAGDGPRPRRW